MSTETARVRTAIGVTGGLPPPLPPDSLATLLTALHAPRDVGAVARAVAVAAAAVTASDRVDVLVARTGALVAATDDTRRFDLRRHPHLAAALACETPVDHPDLLDTRLTDDERAWVAALRARSIALVPLRAASAPADEPVGLLVLTTSRRRPRFPAAAVDRLTTVARHAALALRHALAYQRACRERDLAAACLAVSRDLAASRSVEDVRAAVEHGLAPLLGDADTGESALVESLASQVGAALHRIALFSDVQRLAVEDPLTGAANRRQFTARLAIEWARARRSGSALSLLLLDVDDFKRLNDAHGHPAGDRALVALARCLRESVRATDLVARLGGDEFVLLLPDTPADGAHVLFAKLTQRAAVATAAAGIPCFTVSGGIATSRDHAHSAEELIERADRALYAAKASGKNCVRRAIVQTSR